MILNKFKELQNMIGKIEDKYIINNYLLNLFEKDEKTKTKDNEYPRSINQNYIYVNNVTPKQFKEILDNIKERKLGKLLIDSRMLETIFNIFKNNKNYENEFFKILMDFNQIENNDDITYLLIANGLQLNEKNNKILYKKVSKIDILKNKTNINFIFKEVKDVSTCLSIFKKNNYLNIEFIKDLMRNISEEDKIDFLKNTISKLPLDKEFLDENIDYIDTKFLNYNPNITSDLINHCFEKGYIKKEGNKEFFEFLHEESKLDFDFIIKNYDMLYDVNIVYNLPKEEEMNRYLDFLNTKKIMSKNAIYDLISVMSLNNDYDFSIYERLIRKYNLEYDLKKTLELFNEKTSGKYFKIIEQNLEKKQELGTDEELEMKKIFNDLIKRVNFPEKIIEDYLPYFLNTESNNVKNQNFNDLVLNQVIPDSLYNSKYFLNNLTNEGLIRLLEQIKNKEQKEIVVDILKKRSSEDFTIVEKKINYSLCLNTKYLINLPFSESLKLLNENKKSLINDRKKIILNEILIKINKEILTKNMKNINYIDYGLSL